MKSLWVLVLVVASVLHGGGAVAAAAATDSRGVQTERFLAKHFPQAPPEAHSLWLRGELADDLKQILGRPLSRLRVRYWQQEARSAWVLEEIGKELPITAGFIINQGVLEAAEVLVYRESRGGEIQYTSFLQQFGGLHQAGGRLSQNIDNISGATLSVRSMKKMAAMALRLSESIRSDEPS